MIALVGGTLIDGNGGAPVRDAALLIDGERIAAAGPIARVSIPNDARRVVVAGKTIMPGLIDGHTHISGQWSPDASNALRGLPELAPIRGVAAARRMLDAGFTAARAMSSAGYENVALKLAIDEGLVPGPRLIAAGPMLRAVLSATGWAPPLPYPNAPDAIINGPLEARKAVRLQHAHGVDIVETAVSGLVGNSNGTTALATTTWRFDELEAAVDEAHRLGRQLTANCYHDDAVELCIRAGVDVIEHGCLITERGIAALAGSRTFIVPTLCAYHAYIAEDAATSYPAWQIAAGREVEAQLRRSFTSFVAGGARVFGGSDGALPGTGRRPGEGALELQLMVEHGLTPMQAIVANTKIAAEAMRMDDRIGTLDPGKLADLLVVDADPLSDIGVLRRRDRLALVMKGGAVHATTLDALKSG